MCMNKLLVFSIGILFSKISFCQQAETDSLKKIALTTKDDTVKAVALNKIAWLTTEDDPERSLQNGFEALALAQKTKNKFIEADCYKSIGVAYDYKGNLESCMLNLNNSLSLYKELNNTVKQSNVLSDIAFGYYARGIYELALKNHIAALDLRKKVSDSILLGKSFNNIGLVYKARKDYAKAIEYYQLSLNIKTCLNDEAGMLNTTLNLGSLYQSRLIYDTALYYADKAFNLASKLNKLQDITAALANKGIALFGLKRFDESFILFTQAEKQAVANSCKICMPTIYQGLGNCYLQKNNFATAFEYFSKGLEYTKANRRQENEKDFYKLIAELFYKKGDYQKAYSYKDSADIIEKELLNKENLRQMNEMSAVYETAEKEKQIEKLSLDATVNSKLAGRRKKERNYFIIASALFLLLAGMAYKAFQSNKRKKEQLNKQNAVIEKSLAEKEVLMKEIHHRVKNNLQVVSSLLKLQSHYIKDEAALDAVKESRNRVQSMAIIHQNLYQENNLTGIDAEDYISKLCDNLFTSYNINTGKIKLVKDIAPLMIDVDTIVPLGLILNELISNSLKYAFTKKEVGGIIKIGLKERNKTLLLSVYDNGIGMDKATMENSPSFGYKMIKAFMPKLGGEMNIYNEDGARIDISIKNYQLTTHE